MKKTTKGIIGIIGAILVITIFMWFLIPNRSPKTCTIDYLKELFSSAKHPYSISYGDTNKKENASVLAEMLLFEEWQKIKGPFPEEKIITIVMSEEYEITVYKNYACVYDGYSGIGETSYVYYSIPDKVKSNLDHYITTE